MQLPPNGRQPASQTCEDVQRMSQWLLLRCWKMHMQHDTNEEWGSQMPRGHLRHVAAWHALRF